MYGYIFAQTFSGEFEDVEELVVTSPPGIRFATLLQSGHDLFAAWEGDTVTELASAAAAIVATGASGVDTAVGVLPEYDSSMTTFPLPVPPKFAPTQEHEAFVRVQLGAGADLGFLAATANISAVIGVCTTAGQYSGLVELGASTSGLLIAALNQLRMVAGVTIQSTSYATFPEE